MPIEFAAVDDGTREADGAFQIEIDRMIDTLYARFAVTTSTVHGSVERRAAEVMTMIETRRHRGS